MQTIVDIPEEMVARLDRLGRERDSTPDQIVRAALAAYLPPAEPKAHLLDYFGVLQGKIEDGQVFQDRMRCEWEPHS